MDNCYYYPVINSSTISRRNQKKKMAEKQMATPDLEAQKVASDVSTDSAKGKIITIDFVELRRVTDKVGKNIKGKLLGIWDKISPEKISQIASPIANIFSPHSDQQQRTSQDTSNSGSIFPSSASLASTAKIIAEANHLLDPTDNFSLQKNIVKESKGSFSLHQTEVKEPDDNFSLWDFEVEASEEIQKKDVANQIKKKKEKLNDDNSMQTLEANQQLRNQSQACRDNQLSSYSKKDASSNRIPNQE
ncbi:MAG TPA: hypothetical protein VFV08_04210, partial [Puia sp.]|nr:hypothetical protein [Puia sp.]